MYKQLIKIQGSHTPWKSLNFKIKIQGFESPWKLQSLLESPWNLYLISSNIDSRLPYVKIYATGRNVATHNSKKQVKTIIIPIDFAVRGVLEKWKICPWKSLKSPWTFSPKKGTNPENWEAKSIVFHVDIFLQSWWKKLSSLFHFLFSQCLPKWQ